MYYIKKRDEDLFWYDYVCGCHVWKHLSRCRGWDSGYEAVMWLLDLQLGEEAIVDFIAEEGDN